MSALGWIGAGMVAFAVVAGLVVLVLAGLRWLYDRAFPAPDLDLSPEAKMELNRRLAELARRRTRELT